MKCFGYYRVSGNSQIDGDGIPRQQDTTAKYAANNGIEIVRNFKDEGVCGELEPHLRPGLSELLSTIEGSDVRLVLIERIDRLARKLAVQELILAKFMEMGVKVIACDSGMELTTNADDDPTRTLLRQILGAFAQWSRAEIVLKTRKARERIRATGRKCEGRKEQVSALDLSRIREMRAIGDDFKTIADTMTEYGPNRWHVTTLRAICKRHKIPKRNDELPTPEWLKPL